MTSPNHFPVEHHEKKRKLYKPRVIKVLFSLILFLFVTQFFQLKVLSKDRDQAMSVPRKTNLVIAQIISRTSSDCDEPMFANEVNTFPDFNRKTSEIDGTLVVKR